MSNQEKRIELANFLRTRRQSLQPEQVGLPRRKNSRRTPGLRREEVAELSDISVTWYTWLEQGRDIHISALALNRLVMVLQLDSAQREYLFALALPQPPLQLSPSLEVIPPRIRLLLDAHKINPAYLLGPHFDILAWNQMAADVFCNFEKIPPAQRNALALLFSGHMRALIVNWKGHARHALAAFRGSASRKINEPWCVTLIEELLKQNPEFRVWWSQREVQRMPEIYIELNHPMVGHLVLERTVLIFDENLEMRILVYTPQPGTDSTIKLQQLAAYRAAVPIDREG